MNTLSWTSFVSIIFKSDAAKSRPWRALGINPMTWASRERRKAELTTAWAGGESFEPVDYSDVVDLTPEAACIEYQTLDPEPEVYVPVTLGWRRPGLPAVHWTPCYVEAVPFQRIASTLVRKAARFAA